MENTTNKKTIYFLKKTPTDMMVLSHQINNSENKRDSYDFPSINYISRKYVLTIFKSHHQIKYLRTITIDLFDVITYRLNNYRICVAGLK